jgi:prepilin peptidase CpaA
MVTSSIIETAMVAAVATVVLAAALVDVRTRRIPNVLTATALLVALVLRAFLGGPALLDGVLGAGAAFVVLLPLFAMGGVGGGDAKLLIAVGAFLGLKVFFIALLATAVVGGIMAILYSIRRGVILPLLLNTGGLMKFMLTFGRAGERPTRESTAVLSVPYGVAIAAGTLFALWYGGAA